MTNSPGDQPPNEPTQPLPSGQPGYREQRGQQPGPQYGYPPQGAAPQPPMQYAPDHPRATTALVLGILGIVACQVLAPVAWVIGKKAVDEIDAARGALGGRGAAQAGYVLGVIGTLLLGLGLVLLVLMLIGIVALGTVSTSP